jgi:hypothetical protein
MSGRPPVSGSSVCGGAGDRHRSPKVVRSLAWAVIGVPSVVVGLAVFFLAGCGLVMPVLALPDLVAQARVEFSPDRMPGTLQITRCSSYYKASRGRPTLLHHCSGDFAPDTGAPPIPDVTLVDDIREVPTNRLLRGVVVPGDHGCYRPEPSGILYCLPLVMTPLFLAFAALRMANARTRRRLRLLASAGMAVTAMAAIPGTLATDWLRNGGSWW